MTEVNATSKKTAILGWSIPAIEAMDKLDRPYVVVGPPDFISFAKEHDIDFIPWDFDRLNEGSDELYKRLNEMGVKLSIPIYEETVEWAGVLNARFFDDPRVFNRSLLLRDKGLMKRKAQMSGIKVGVFEEAYSKDDIHRFLKRVNDALIKIDGDTNDPIHIKPLNKAGTVGHMMIQDANDIDKIEVQEFPYLMESARFHRACHKPDQLCHGPFSNPL